jgi:hypothetical protein
MLNPDEPRQRNRNAEELEELRRLGMAIRQMSQQANGQQQVRQPPAKREEEEADAEEEEERDRDRESAASSSDKSLAHRTSKASPKSAAEITNIAIGTKRVLQIRQRVEALLAQGKMLRDLISKRSETDRHFEHLWEAFVEEGSDLRDLLDKKASTEREVESGLKALAIQFKVYRQLVKTGKAALTLLPRMEKVKRNADERQTFVQENGGGEIRSRFERGEKHLLDLLSEGASGESEEGVKLHKRLWLNKLGRALDEQAGATQEFEQFLATNVGLGWGRKCCHSS